ncbi:MAG TPA: Sec-independent protein translocase protein TatB [Acidimicrobiales bacterium]|nr:Sec-independent protein translocase protein TatB [Acidimicrobiales bacterium]
MGSIGPLEVVVILVVALVVLGPNRLPDAARSVGKAFAELRRMTTGFQSEVRDAFTEPPSYPKRPPQSIQPAALPARPEEADVTPAAEPAPPVAEPRPAD